MQALARMMAALVLALMLGSAPSHAQDRGIEETITQQLEAFKIDDFGAAFDYASPTIKNIFRTPENFGAMVRQGYPMVWRPGVVTYLEQREIAGAIWQKVQIVDGAGRVHILDYQMIQTAEGWQINGVQLLRQPDVAA
jgi:hypothetical protein